MYEKAKKENADYVECNFIWEYPNKSKIDIGIEYKNSKEMMAFARVVAWNKLIKTDLINTNNLLFPKGLRYEDIEFFYKILPYIQKFTFVKEPLIHYVQRESSIANTQNEKTTDIFKILDNVIKYYKEKNIYQQYKDELEYNYARLLLCSSLLRITKISDKEIRDKVIKENWNKLNTDFPNWRKNKIIKNTKSLKNIYLKTVNKFTYKMYSEILKIK